MSETKVFSFGEQNGGFGGNGLAAMLPALGYDQKGEEACYIAGETAERMYKVANKFLCEHCRKH